MTLIGQPERVTQDRVIALFRDELGYEYLGDWTYREGNSNIEEGLLTAYLQKQGYNAVQVSRALHELTTEATYPNRTLLENNQKVYSLLRYGLPIKVAAGETTETIHLIDWAHPERNDFAIAEEVTLRGRHDRRPDLVLYVNGLALAVIELKNSRTSLGEGIRQSLSNQSPTFHAWFFSTVQMVFAGNDSEGLRYGTVGTEEKLFLTWKEDETDDQRFKLDKYLLKLCEKTRFLELIHDFVLFDAGIKKLPRVHQYFGVKAAQAAVMRHQGGIIWHTQGSGKSIVMVLLAKWILENRPHARVAIITDREELDKQIQGVFTDTGETMKRSASGRDLMQQLGQPSPRLLCSLIHKFGVRHVDDFEGYLKGLESQPSPTVGEVFVFVDECHRTQSGKLRRLMKALMPQAIFIGFTGTPLLKKDKQTSLEVFGGYIHTYKFSEAVSDAVILDLVYEARDIDQRLGSADKIDAWFDAKTSALNEWQKAALREHWGTLQKVLSSRSRMERVVTDIVFDFSVKPRLSSERGNAMLVAGSIFEACQYYTLFQKTPFRGKCALITSYNPQATDISREETGAHTETDKQFIYATYTALLAPVQPRPGQTKTETYEEEAKAQFKKAPALMKLLIVVDKLLTGFDAPPCTYLYIDKTMQDHGLFQAICRTNRLDGEDKDFGHIVDYKDLFRKVQNAVAVYSSELDNSAPGVDPAVLLQERLTRGRERLESAREAYALILEPIAPPCGEREVIRYFCGNTEMVGDLKACEPRRQALYQATVGLVRAYAGIADELQAAGYSKTDATHLQKTVDDAVKRRDIVRMASGETLDLKAYEADMRHLIDTYISADEPRVISPFADISLVDLIVRIGMHEAIDTLPEGIRTHADAVAETIENNVRRRIIKEQLTDPAYFARMSELLDEIIAARHARALEYEAYLQQMAALVTQIDSGQNADLPPTIHSPGLRALYHNLGNNEADAIAIDQAVKRVRSDGWRGIQTREQVIKRAVYDIVHDEALVERLFPILCQQAEY